MTKLIRTWIYKDFLGNYHSGYYLNSEVRHISVSSCHDTVKSALINQAKKDNLQISMIIEYANFKDVIKNKEGN